MSYMTLQQALRQLGSDFSALTVNCYHYWRPKMRPPFLVWQEDAEGDNFGANNRKAERQITGSLHYFTKAEYDRTIDAAEALLGQKMTGWTLDSVQYEDETNLIHYQWTWTAVIQGWEAGSSGQDTV